jgi:hypothetical protein
VKLIVVIDHTAADTEPIILQFTNSLGHPLPTEILDPRNDVTTVRYVCYQPRHFWILRLRPYSFAVNSGTILNRSPTSPMSAT